MLSRGRVELHVILFIGYYENYNFRPGTPLSRRFGVDHGDYGPYLPAAR